MTSKVLVILIFIHGWMESLCQGDNAPYWLSNTQEEEEVNIRCEHLSIGRA